MISRASEDKILIHIPHQKSSICALVLNKKTEYRDCPDFHELFWKKAPLGIERPTQHYIQCEAERSRNILFALTIRLITNPLGLWTYRGTLTEITCHWVSGGHRRSSLATSRWTSHRMLNVSNNTQVSAESSLSLNIAFGNT